MMPTVHCDNCDRKINIKAARVGTKPYHLCMFCSRSLPDKYRCEGFRKGTSTRCKQPKLEGGMCIHHQDQRSEWG